MNNTAVLCKYSTAIWFLNESVNENLNGKIASKISNELYVIETLTSFYFSHAKQIREDLNTLRTGLRYINTSISA